MSMLKLGTHQLPLMVIVVVFNPAAQDDQRKSYMSFHLFALPTSQVIVNSE